jgi:hypothetical protein
MSASSQPPDRVPTLTEVVAWPDSAPASPAVASQEARAFEDESAGDVGTEVAVIAPSQLEERITQRVLADLQRQVELMLEYRMREMLTPVLNRLADNVVREVRSELASTLRDVVARAVAQEIARHRTP